MPASSVRRYISLSIHVLVWALIGYILLVFLPLTSEVKFPPQFWVKQGISFMLYIGAFYLNARVWVPRLLFRQRSGRFLIANLATILMVVLVIIGVEIWLEVPKLTYLSHHPDAAPASAPTFPPTVVLVGTGVTSLLLILISTSVAVVQKWQKDEQIRQRLEQEKVSSELSFLKAQINPHFFFNTLNNIHALTEIDAELARQALRTLSRMMRYVLYETQKDVTYLSKEITFLQDYIELMKLRLNDNVQVTFSPPQPLNDVVIAPMLFLPFVENAFKHGVSGTKSSCIHISFKQQGSELELKVRNTTFKKDSATLDTGSGIGLTNTHRRLDLLYPHRHTLSIDDTNENEYHVQLTLELS
jgi:hypothetical protein